MKKLSSDLLFYTRLTIEVIAPIFFVTLISTGPFKHHPSWIILGLMPITGITAYRIYRLSKFRQVIYQEEKLIITNYFTKVSVIIPVMSVVNLTKTRSLQGGIVANLSYKLTYTSKERNQTVYFLKALEIYNIDNIALLIGVARDAGSAPPDIASIDSKIAASFKLNVKSRFTSAVMDWFSSGTIAMVLTLPYMVYTMNDVPFSKPSGILWDIAMIGFAALFCKDCIHGQSFGKRIMRQQVVNNKTGEIANPLRCFVRNIFIILWPVEGLITLLSPQRRLGDFIAGTKVILFHPELKRSELNKVQVALAFSIAYAAMIVSAAFMP